MKVTKDQIFKLCEEVHRLKRLGDSLIKSEDWKRKTFASCELANSIMNNMTSVENSSGAGGSCNGFSTYVQQQ